MSRGRARSLIPLHRLNLALWPRPDERGLKPEYVPLYLARKHAVEMYAADATWEDIYRDTSVRKREVRRLVKRCLLHIGNAEIWGLHALVPNVRLSYKRSAPVHHIPGIGSAGCAGALIQLLDEDSDLEDLLDDLLDRALAPGSIRQSRLDYVEVASEFRKELRRRGFTDEQWPFNTDDWGVQAIRRYNIRRLKDEETSFIRGRYGKEAAHRGAIGWGRRSLIPIIRPYSYLQMDYQMIDTASIIVMKHPIDGCDVEINVARWHVGLICEESKKVVVGAHIVLERTPSSDSSIATVASMFLPSLPDGSSSDQYLQELTGDRRFLAMHFLPDLQGQCAYGIRVDNGWAFDAAPTLELLVDRLGMAVNFGRVRGWWRRHIVERIFLEMTRKGAQRLISTVGSRPKDPKADKPAANAIKHRILISEVEAVVKGVIREYNARPTEALLGISPIQAMGAAIANPQSGFIRQRLPNHTVEDEHVAYSRDRIRVAGAQKRHQRPYLESQGVRWTNDQLAKSYHLVGKWIDVYFHIFDSSRAYAIVPDTGEHLGELTPSELWRSLKLHRRDVKLIHRWARKQRRKMDDPQVVPAYMKKKRNELATRGKSKREAQRKSPDALVAARLARAAKNPPFPDFPATGSTNAFQSNPFGLGDVPPLEDA